MAIMFEKNTISWPLDLKKGQFLNLKKGHSTAD